MVDHLVSVSERLLEQYRSFLLTEFPFRDAGLRTSFAEALSQAELVREPYLELAPRYRRGASPDRVIRELLGAEPDQAFLKAIRSDRLLYLHQEEALRRVWAGRNVVIATGTGSGKTEAFLLPILLRLYQEWLQGTLSPGVRALILYPMNALAFDQRARLAEIAKRLVEQNSPFRFTFGQYTGTTPENAQDLHKKTLDWEDRRAPHTIRDGERVLHGELIYRSEMRAEPPHILITNYSMLEYLLIRPADSPFFDGGAGRTWEYLVVDEAHTYSGVRGQELGLLLRRLKERLRQGGKTGGFHCIATSATLFSGDEARSRAADFASRLFQEPFFPDDVITGERSRLIDIPSAEQDPEQKLLLERLESLLEEGPRPLGEIATALFGGQDGQQERLLQLLEVLSHEAESTGESPIAALRLHVFLRGLEGVYLRYTPTPKIMLSNLADQEGEAFEVALCRGCGQHYLVGQIKGETFTSANRDYSSPQFNITYLLPVETEEEATHRLCTICGKLTRDGHCREHSHVRGISVKYDPQAHNVEAGELRYCLACGMRTRDPVRDIVYGGEWPQAVITTTLLELLPAERQKVLAFADGRQDAAYFAVCLDQWARDLAVRRALQLVLQQASEEESREGLSLIDLQRGLLGSAPQLFHDSAAATRGEKQSNAWRAVIRELVAAEDDRSLPAAGLAYWRLAWPGLKMVSDEVAGGLGLASDQLAEVVEHTLLTLVVTNALAFSVLGASSVVPDEFHLRSVRLGGPKTEQAVVSWDGVEGRTPNRRVDYLVRVLRQYGGEQEAAELRGRAGEWLRRVWAWIMEQDRAVAQQDRLLLQEQPAGFRLNPRWLRLVPFRAGQPRFRCRCCGRTTVLYGGGVCPRYLCPGTLEPAVDPNEDRHFYRTVYSASSEIKRFWVEEHTAQLTAEKAQEYQMRFSCGDLHVLSSSTTFELGVDLGDIDVVFMRNVPPEPFNYAQRAGRVGRRHRAGLVVTFCRNRPHDLYHFYRPERLLQGQVQTMTPRAASERVTQRHVNAMIFSRYFRRYPDRFQDVERLIGGEWTQPALLRDLRAYINEDYEAIRREIEAVLGAREAQRCDWINAVCAADGVLARAIAEVCQDYFTVTEFERVSREAARYRDAEWARQRGLTIAREDVLSFLSRKAVIPKYGFPVDVVELTVPDRSQGVELTRDLRLAIVEYAPGRAVIANKYEWRSSGLKVVAGRALPRRWFRACSKHGSYVEAEYGVPSPQLTLPCRCRGEQGEYLQPIFGFFVGRDDVRPASLPDQQFFTSSYFVAHDYEDNALTSSVYGTPPCIKVFAVARRMVVVLNRGPLGRGFLICPRCGLWLRQDRRRSGEHRGRDGNLCSGRASLFALGHSFLTDVVRLDFLLPPEEGDVEALTHGLIAALVAGVSLVLEVPASEVGGGPEYRGGLPTVVLFDDVPGGGGVVARLEDPRVLRRVLEIARDRVNGQCGCGPNGSCYACLRTFRNQWAHGELRRGLVDRYLGEILERWSSSS